MPSILLTNEQAEAAIRNRLPTGTNLNSRQIADNWDDDARSKAFFSSRVAQADILAGFQRRIQQVVEGKISAGEAREWMRQLIESKGDNVLAQMGFKGAQEGKEGGITELASTSRLNLIIDQNVTMSHQSAAYQQAQDDLEFYPYVEYVSQDDGRVRPSHAALHGKIFKAGSDEAALCWPPNGFRCRCRMRRLHAHEVKGRKIESGMPADYLEKKAQDTDTFSFDPRKQLPTAMQPRETWAPEVAKAYSEGVKSDIDVEIAFMEKRRQVWLKEFERAKKPSYKAETLDAVANIDERLANLRKQKQDMDTLANTSQDHANKKQAEDEAKKAQTVENAVQKPQITDMKKPIEETQEAKTARIAAEKEKIINGSHEKVSIEASKAYLDEDPKIKTVLDIETKWKPRIWHKYAEGEGKSDGKDPERLTHIAQAVLTLKEGEAWKAATQNNTGFQYHFIKEFGKIVMVTRKS